VTVFFSSLDYAFSCKLLMSIRNWVHAAETRNATSLMLVVLTRKEHIMRHISTAPHFASGRVMFPS
jgi:hypothetical protein